MKYADFTVQNPIVFAKINPVQVSIEEYKRDTIETQTRILQELPYSFWIFDSRHTKLLPSEHRIAAGNWLKQHSKTMKERVRAVFVIECSFWTELVLKSIFLVIQPPFPIHVLKTANDAYQLLEEKYQLHVPMEKRLK